MNDYATIAQIFIAFSIIVVWVFRFDNIVQEFKQYGLPDLVRNIVGATKIALSTLLVTGIWHMDLAPVSALLMAFLMLCAQIAHFKVKNPWHKHLPSLGLMLLSLYVVAIRWEILTL